LEEQLGAGLVVLVGLRRVGEQVPAGVVVVDLDVGTGHLDLPDEVDHLLRFLPLVVHGVVDLDGDVSRPGLRAQFGHLHRGGHQDHRGDRPLQRDVLGHDRAVRESDRDELVGHVQRRGQRAGHQLVVADGAREGGGVVVVVEHLALVLVDDADLVPGLRETARGVELAGAHAEDAVKKGDMCHGLILTRNVRPGTRNTFACG
jgi:hypothetical protein